jgi:hypothetical protein
VWCAVVAAFSPGMTSPRYSGAEQVVRVATFNASLYGQQAGQLQTRLSDGTDPQAESIAAIVQTIRPEILLINEVDYDRDGATARLLAEKFFSVSHRQQQPIDYPHILAVPCNTGVDSGLDLDGDGVLGQPGDAWGYGVYPGQYGMAVYSRYPLESAGIRTFQRYLWSALPGALRPTDPCTGQPDHDDAVWRLVRLSSKNHVDVPIRVGGTTIHLLASHPTPPVFDGPEDRNGCRNHDEIRFWLDYLRGPASTHLIDDLGNAGGLPEQASFVIAGDLNADPYRGASRPTAIGSLLADPRLLDPKPQRRGAVETVRPETNGDAGAATASFGPGQELRVDYVLPSKDLRLIDAGVFWPATQESGDDLISASDHRLVWVEVGLP